MNNMASADIFLLCVCTWLLCCLEGLQAATLECPAATVVNQTIRFDYKVFADQTDCPLAVNVQFEFITKGTTSGTIDCLAADFPATSCNAASICGECVEQGTESGKTFYVYRYQFKAVEDKEGGQVTATMCPDSIERCDITFETPGSGGSSGGCETGCIVGIVIGIVAFIAIIVGVVVYLKKKGTI